MGGALLALLLALLAGCAGAPVRAPAEVPAARAEVQPPAAAPITTPSAAQDAAGAALDVRIDDARSVLRLRVYRGGTLARLGHNHVIVAPLRGSAALLADRVARLDLETEPAGWRIDEAHERQRAGAGFESVPDAAAIAGTRTNLLSAALLDAERHPQVRIRGQGGLTAPDRLAMALELHVQGRTVPLAVELQVAQQQDGWRGTGSTRLSHAQLGLTPFSALGGALKVEDAIDVEIEVWLLR
jgi:hypothetical protein